MKYPQTLEKIPIVAYVYALILIFPHTAEAMHIMEGYLPLIHCIAWYVVCIPFVAIGVMSIRHILQKKKRLLILLAMSGAFVFVLSSLKLPSVTGSSSHMTGTGLAAILFGPAITSVLGIIALLFQAVLLAHGGLTTLGANTFALIAGSLFVWSLYALGKKLNLNRKVNIFAAAALGDLFAYCVTAVQLAAAYPSETGGVTASAVKFLGVFAPTQLPLAVVGGLLTVLIVIGLENFAKPELKEIAFWEAK